MTDHPTAARRDLRARLRLQREAFAASDAAPAAQAALARHLGEVLARLEPQRLGLYWPVRAEFNAVSACNGDNRLFQVPFALPFCRRAPPAMHYRAWDRREPGVVDECGIPAPAGAEVEPDVVLAPCVGFTRSGYRLGYGGGFFDRWLAAHPHVTAIGVSWALGEVDEALLAPQAHDVPLMLVVTEHGVAGG